MSSEQSIRDELAAVIESVDIFREKGEKRPWELRQADAVLASPVIRRIQAEAEARAYRHAADVARSEARWQWERSKMYVPGAQIVAQRMQVIEASLKGFADRIERGETA